MRELVELIRGVEWGQVSSYGRLRWGMRSLPLLDGLPRMVGRSFGLSCWGVKRPLRVVCTLRVVSVNDGHVVSGDRGFVDGCKCIELQIICESEGEAAELENRYGAI